MQHNDDRPVSVVTGSNSGIGRSTAVRLAVGGHRVFATMRDTGRADKVLELAERAGVAVEPITLDVSDDASVREGMAEILDRAGRVDVLVNNAGIGYNAVTEDLDLDRCREVFEANFYGIVRCSQAVLPGMRARGSGHISNVSSVTGRFAALAQVAYSASKFAVEALSESMAQELVSYGIGVSIIEPGITRTAIMAKNADSPEGTVYDWAYRREFAFYAAGLRDAVSPDVVADTIWEAVTTSTPKLRWRCAWGADELVLGRAKMSDEDWVSLGACADDEAYADRFRELFGLDISPS
ncbi:MAG: SDR family oxidoreductase [Actinobacteria bacterium]|nr:SDR family oxidoreductase [Actinomycetota bacterium]